MRALVIAAIALTAACGGAVARRPRTNVAPPQDAEGALPTVANRNGPPPEASPRESSISLWCSQPGGPACAAAEQALGTAPTPAETTPRGFLEGSRDTEDDCADPDVAALMQRVTSAVGAGPRWIDHDGQLTGPATFADPYGGAGCTGLPQPAEPLVKIQAADAPEGVRFLVRIWEIGDVS
ncbi:MAG: hypothetical protein H6719_12905 [Sandaracinaceae bacterium]|nr:hypothetical protein [Sandaracinaceae bacterium]